MTQNVEEENDLHDFNDIEPRELRDYNRGAVLANIHDTYVSEGYIPGQAIHNWLSELNAYLSRIPADEVEGAKAAMRLHLNKRGTINVQSQQAI